MKGGVVALIIVLAVILLIGALLVFNNNSNNMPESGIPENNRTLGSENDISENSNASGDASEDGNSNREQQSQTYNIEIKNFDYSSQEIRIKTGDIVIWTNKDSVKHTITSDSGNELDSQLLSKDGEYSHIFMTAGVFEYHCAPHPYMKAKVIVE